MLGTFWLIRDLFHIVSEASNVWEQKFYHIQFFALKFAPPNFFQIFNSTKILLLYFAYKIKLLKFGN